MRSRTSSIALEIARRRQVQAVHPRAQLRSPQTVVLPHADECYAGIFISRIGEAPILSRPRHLDLALRATAERWSAAEVLHGTGLRTWLGDRVEQMIGPAFIGYADHTTFQAIEPNPACLLGGRDEPQIARLRAACDAVESQYRTLDSHRPSIHLAQTLGFVRYGTSMAVRLRRPAP